MYGGMRCRTIISQTDHYCRLMQTVYDAIGGLDGLRRLARAWHERVLADDVVSHSFTHGFYDEHTERLARYWAEALGGPATYTATLGDAA